MSAPATPALAHSAKDQVVSAFSKHRLAIVAAAVALGVVGGIVYARGKRPQQPRRRSDGERKRSTRKPKGSLRRRPSIAEIVAVETTAETAVLAEAAVIASTDTVITDAVIINIETPTDDEQAAVAQPRKAAASSTQKASVAAAIKTPGHQQSDSATELDNSDADITAVAVASVLAHGTAWGNGEADDHSDSDSDSDSDSEDEHEVPATLKHTTATVLNMPASSELNVNAHEFVPSFASASSVAAQPAVVIENSEQPEEKEMAPRKIRCAYWPKCRYGTQNEQKNLRRGGSGCVYGSRCYFYHQNEEEWLTEHGILPPYQPSRGQGPAPTARKTRGPRPTNKLMRKGDSVDSRPSSSSGSIASADGSMSSMNGSNANTVFILTNEQWPALPAALAAAPQSSFNVQAPEFVPGVGFVAPPAQEHEQHQQQQQPHQHTEYNLDAPDFVPGWMMSS
ncbi:hypothetical protein RI367_000719 [Sorochytrium milnesiophthora]